MRYGLILLVSSLLMSCSQPDYLEKAAAEPGAKKTASGLVYRELRPGTGASPKATDTVKVHYRGTLRTVRSSIAPMPGTNPPNSR